MKAKNYVLVIFLTVFMSGSVLSQWNYDYDNDVMSHQAMRTNLGNSIYLDDIDGFPQLNLVGPRPTITLIPNAGSGFESYININNFSLTNINNDLSIANMTQGLNMLTFPSNGQKVIVGTKLEVTGDINFTGNLYKNGQLFSGGSGTSLWNSSGSNIYYTTGNVGIGTTSLSYKLNVGGDINFTGNLFQNGQPFGGGNSVWTKDASNNISYSGGNMGLGTTTAPQKKLTIFGNPNNGQSCGIRMDNGTWAWDIENDAWSNLNFNMGGTLRFSLSRDNDFYIGTPWLTMYPSTDADKDMFSIDMYNTSSYNKMLTLRNHQAVEIFVIQQDGTIHVNGKILATEVEIKQNIWADDVFSKNYQLMSLTELEKYISAHQHLPNVPTEAEVKEKGVNVAEMNATLLRKVEELTKYVIEQGKKQNETLQKLEELKNENERIKRELSLSKQGNR